MGLPDYITPIASDDERASGGGSSSNQKTKRSKGRFQQGLSSAGRSLSDYGQEALSDVERNAESKIASYKRGGTTRKKGPARLHKGEKVTKRKRGRKNGRR